MCIVSYCYLDTRLVHGDTDIWSLYWAGYFVCAPSQYRFFSAATGRLTEANSALEDHTERLFRRVSVHGFYSWAVHRLLRVC